MLRDLNSSVITAAAYVGVNGQHGHIGDVFDRRAVREWALESAVDARVWLRHRELHRDATDNAVYAHIELIDINLCTKNVAL